MSTHTFAAVSPKNLRAGVAAQSAIGLAVLVMHGSASATSVDATIPTTANVVRTVTVVSVTDLRFGALSVGTTPGTLTVTAVGARSATGGVTLINSAEGHQQATVTLTGIASSGYSVSVPNSATLTSPSGSSSMTIRPLSTNLANGLGLLTPTGVGSFGVGGTLNVAANQNPGLYKGSFAVTLSYN